MKKSYVIGGVVIILAMAMAMYSFKSTLTSYVTLSEAKASNRPVQVAGIVVEGTDRYDLKSNNLLFTLREDGGDEMKVEYDGKKITVTVSIGVAATITNQTFEKKLLISAADKALYKAKREGRNAVRVTLELEAIT